MQFFVDVIEVVGDALFANVAVCNLRVLHKANLNKDDMYLWGLTFFVFFHFCVKISFVSGLFDVEDFLDQFEIYLLMRKDEAGSEISAVIVELRRNKMDLIFCDSE
jgi:hypothetical protein